jgi:hypothetical protein
MKRVVFWDVTACSSDSPTFMASIFDSACRLLSCLLYTGCPDERYPK